MSVRKERVKACASGGPSLSFENSLHLLNLNDDIHLVSLSGSQPAVDVASRWQETQRPGAQVVLVLDIRDHRWTEFVARNPRALPYHHPAWAGLLAECYRFRPMAVVNVDGSGQVTGGLPVLELGMPWRARRWVSLPFTDYCPPLVAPPGAAHDLVAELGIARRAAGLERIEVRADLKGGGAYQNQHTAWMHTLALGPDPAEVFRSFHRSQVQRNIARAERSGVSVRIGTSAAALVEDFYGLHVQTRRRLGVPVQPRRFFTLLWQRFIRPGLGLVLVAYADETPVAAAVFLTWNGTIIYKYGASDEAAWPQRPNHLIFWTAIRWGCENGYHSFDFGRTDRESHSLRQFKRYWGTQEHELAYSVVADRPPPTSRGHLSRGLGAVIRRSPPMVCRIAGELLYRYAA